MSEAVSRSQDLALLAANAASVFDLSPTEKLQLVEDLWDDLAATPENVPVHEWQKEVNSRFNC